MNKLMWAVVLSVAALSMPAAGFPQTNPRSPASSDAWVATQIRAKFFLDKDLKGRNLDVETAAGVVTLSGDVSNEAERARALADARATEGVRKVVDNLAVAAVDRPATGPGAEWPGRAQHGKAAVDRIGKEISDTWLTTKVQAIYFLDRDVKGMQIDVTTKDGVVTLTGAVDSGAARQKAVADATSVDGVKQVVDKLTVKPKGTSGSGSGRSS
jgi:hyperosmotically inducible protein